MVPLHSPQLDLGTLGSGSAISHLEKAAGNRNSRLSAPSERQLMQLDHPSPLPPPPSPTKSKQLIIGIRACQTANDTDMGSCLILLGLVREYQPAAWEHAQQARPWMTVPQLSTGTLLGADWIPEPLSTGAQLQQHIVSLFSAPGLRTPSQRKNSSCSQTFCYWLLTPMSLGPYPSGWRFHKD